MAKNSSTPRFNYWLCLRTDTQVEHAKTLPGFSQDRYVPTARADRRRQVTFGTRAETDAAKIALHNRFPTLKEPAVKVPPRFLGITELQEIGFSEEVRDGWWKGKRGVRRSPKPWDVYVTLTPNDERFAEPRNYAREVLPGSYGPLPIPSTKTYEVGELLWWLERHGVPFPYLRPTHPYTHRFAVTRTVAMELRNEFS